MGRPRENPPGGEEEKVHDSDRPMADFQYILPGAVGLPQGSNLYLWNPHIICGRTSMYNRHQSSVRGVTRVPGVDGVFALRGDYRELSDRPGGLL